MRRCNSGNRPIAAHFPTFAFVKYTRDSSVDTAEILAIANFAIADELFAIAKSHVVLHIKIAFQASSPKTFGLVHLGWPFFCPTKFNRCCAAPWRWR